MRRPSTSRRPGPAGLASALAGLALAAGCTHNHYYGATPAYVVPGETVIVDEVCALPGRPASGPPPLVTRAEPVEASPAPSDPDVVASSRSSRVVISRPIGGPVAGRGWSALGRGDRLVTTEVHGGADASLVR